MQQTSGRIQVLKWLQNMIEQQRKSSEIKYEIESKIGKFIGKNNNAHRQLLDLGESFTQLNKNDFGYEFQSRITLEQFKLAEQHLEISKKHRILRVDLNFSNKDQRVSLIYDQRKEEVPVDAPPYKGSGILTYVQPLIGNLTEKRRQLMNHIDIVSGALNYRISLSSEKELSTSLKDIYIQINSRQDRVAICILIPKIALIRVKETNIYEDELFERSLSTVYSIFKNNTLTFKGIIAQLLDSKNNAKESINKVFELVESNRLKNNLLDEKLHPSYELEVELKQEALMEDKEQNVAEHLLEQTEVLCEVVNKPALLRRTGSQEFHEDPPQKKIKM